MEPQITGKTKKLLLLIEDNPLLVGMYSAAFEKAGFRVVFAHNGEEGLRLAKAKMPDGVILDLMLPGLDGYQILEKINQDQALKNIKVIVLSSVSKPEELDRARKLGALDCLQKADLNLAQIIEKVESYF